MSISINLTVEDTDKLIDTVNLLDFIASSLEANDTLQLSVNNNLSIVYTSQDIQQISSFYREIVDTLRYNHYDTDLSTDQDYINSLV